MTERVTISGDQMTSQSLPNAGEVRHSTNNDADGITVRSGPAGFSRQSHNVSDLNDSDIIAIDGMEITAKVARDLGLLNKVYDEGLNAGSASQRSEVPEQRVDVIKKSDTGHTEYDTAIDSLNEHIDNGSMTPAEGQAYDLGLAEIAMSGLSIESVTETLEGLANGTVAESDVPANVRATVIQVETAVEKAATSAAMAELGKPAFEALSQLASSHAGANQVIRQYAIDRAQGKHDGVTWPELYQDIQEQLGNA